LAQVCSAGLFWLVDLSRLAGLTPEARRLLVTEGYDPSFGARPLKRAIQRLLQNPLAMAVLEGRFVEGDRILVGAKRDGELAFEKAGEPEVATV
jgi:ATP-dependent Clp protease ATP-binding subunit ClpA